MPFRTISEREKILLGMALLAVLISLYALVRYKPQQLEYSRVTEEVQQLKNGLKSARIPRPKGQDANSLQQQIDKTQRDLDRSTSLLTSYEQQFVNIDSAEAVQGVVVQISNLARTSGVIIRETLQYSDKPFVSRGTDEVLLTEALIAGHIFQRPARNMTIEGSYRAMRRFLIGMGQLSKRVVVLRFSMEVVPMLDQQQKLQQLKSSLLVSL